MRVVIVTTKRERHWQRTWTNLQMKKKKEKKMSSIESNVFYCRCLPSLHNDVRGSLAVINRLEYDLLV
jgi:hypothetical protein